MPHTLLKRHFGHSTFRPGQRKLIDALCAGRDVLGVMPTGAGKSVCYQLPALLLPGMCIVISPLISLMKDQVAALEQAGIPAACLNSTLSQEEYRQVLRRAHQGAYRLLYVAPERLTTGAFLRLAAQTPLSLVAVDEAHCVSQWGQDFRPSYLGIPEFLSALPRRPPVGAFTATATRQVKRDIAHLLQLQDPVCLTTGFDRPNLFFDVVEPRDKNAWLRTFLARHPQQSGVVYCSTRKQVEEVWAMLLHSGVPAARYHAGLPDEERRLNQDLFVCDRAPVMVATNAFGMGIDKSNVSFVIHYNMPKNLESYYQEAGRAGRDGSSAQCILLFSPADVQMARFLLELPSDNQALTEEEQERVQRQDLQRLQAMVGYCKSEGCLRSQLLGYFGEQAPQHCGNCGNCGSRRVQVDWTVEAQKLLSAVARGQRLHPAGLTVPQVVQMVQGIPGGEMTRLGLDRLSTFGILPQAQAKDLEASLALLVEEHCLRHGPGRPATLLLDHAARPVLFSGAKLLRWERQPITPAPPRPSLPTPSDNALLDALKQVRSQLARKSGLPPYVIFSNLVLQNIALRHPRTKAELLQVSGVSQAKADRYSAPLLEVLNRF